MDLLEYYAFELAESTGRRTACRTPRIITLQLNRGQTLEDTVTTKYASLSRELCGCAGGEADLLEAELEDDNDPNFFAIYF
jgi:hypothetical protein